jgi:hypothetical protein
VLIREGRNIINSYKAKQELERHASKGQFVFWEEVGHAACVPSPDKWKQVKDLMLKQELKIVQER